MAWNGDRVESWAEGESPQEVYGLFLGQAWEKGDQGAMEENTVDGAGKFVDLVANDR